MRSNERMIFVGVAVVALAVGFYMLVLGPKREEASELQRSGRFAELVDHRRGAAGGLRRAGSPGLPQVLRPHGRPRQGRAGGGGYRVAAGAGQFARRSVEDRFPRDHPEPGRRQRWLVHHRGGAEPPPAPDGAARRRPRQRARQPPPAPRRSTIPPAPTAAPAPATEATAAALPIGSMVGPAGLPDHGLQPRRCAAATSTSPTSSARSTASSTPVAGGAQLSPDGRLLTIDGFDLEVSGTGPSPTLKAKLRGHRLLDRRPGPDPRGVARRHRRPRAPVRPRCNPRARWCAK